MEDATYLGVQRQELSLRLRALWQEDADYYEAGEPVTEFRPVSMTVAAADDGVPDLVVVSEVHELGRRLDDDESRHRYDDEWRSRLDERGASYVDWVARRIHLGTGRWPAPDPEAVDAASDDLPEADVLWRQMVQRFGGRVDEAGHVVIGTVTVALTPAQWRELVVECEVAAREDRGPDALRKGDGPGAAIDVLDDLLPGGWSGAGPWSGYVVWWRGALHPSSRLALPPV